LRRGNAVNGAHHLTIFVHVPSLSMTPRQTDQSVQRSDHARASAEGCSAGAAGQARGRSELFWKRSSGRSRRLARKEALIGRRGKIKSSNFRRRLRILQ
jgi:type IV secretion system protein VirB4